MVSIKGFMLMLLAAIAAAYVFIGLMAAYLVITLSSGIQEIVLIVIVALTTISSMCWSIGDLTYKEEKSNKSYMAKKVGRVATVVLAVLAAIAIIVL